MNRTTLIFTALASSFCLLASQPALAGQGRNASFSLGVGAVGTVGSVGSAGRTVQAGHARDGGRDLHVMSGPMSLRNDNRHAFSYDLSSDGTLQLANQNLSLSQIVEIINAQEPGEQLDARLVNEGGRTVYVVRWQASRGRIIIFRVDAQSGQIIGRQG